MGTKKNTKPAAEATNNNRFEPQNDEEKVTTAAPDTAAAIERARAALGGMKAKQRKAVEARHTVKDHNEQAASWFYRFMTALLALWVARIVKAEGFNAERAEALTLAADVDADGNAKNTCVQCVPKLGNGSRGRFEEAADKAEQGAEGTTMRTKGILSCGFSIADAKNRAIGDILFGERAASGLWSFVRQGMYGHLSPKNIEQSEVNALRVVLGLAAAKGTKETLEARQTAAATILRNDVKQALSVAGKNTFADFIKQQRDQSGKATLTIEAKADFGNLTARGLDDTKRAALEGFEPVAMVGAASIQPLADALGVDLEALADALAAHGVALDLKPYAPKAPKDESPAKKAARVIRENMNAADVAVAVVIEEAII